MRDRRKFPGRCRGQGFAIIIMVVALILLGVFALVAGRLFFTAVRVTGQVQAAQTKSTRFDGMIRMLRADVWNANDISSGDGQLRLQAQERATVWSVDEKNDVIRTAPDGSKTIWEGLGAGLVLSKRGGGVFVQVMDVAGREMQWMILESQMRLAGGGAE